MATNYKPKEPTVEERLRRLVINHEAAEEPSMELYRRAAGASDPMVSMVLTAILEDEERHHDLMTKIAVRLTNPNAPKKGAPNENDPTPAEIAELVEHEQFGSKRLHEIADQYKDVDHGLPSLLLHAMAHDSERHEEMLKYVQGRING